MIVWLKRIGLGLLGLLVLIIGGGSAFEAVSRAGAAKTFPAPGRLVDIGGRRLQLDCRGAGSPVVVFESGLDSLGSLSWTPVQDQVAQTTRACAYSRAGLMWSDPSGRPFSAAHEAEDLHKALVTAGEKPPYVLVAHSLGGPYALSFTRLYGGDVAGLVFVDASHPDQLARLRAAAGKDLDQGEAMARTADALAWSGVVRMALGADGAPGPPAAPPAVTRPVTAFMPQSLHALVQESNAIAATLADAGRGRNLGDRPIVVLTHGAPFPPQALKAMQVTPAQGRRLEAEWLAMQNDIASWSTRSRHDVVPGATHYIHFDRPAVVVAAVRDVVGQVRRPAPLPMTPVR